jgi:multimeric flavodoxin WrbA
MFIVITASPNANGLTSACADAALAGIRAAGGEGKRIDLCSLKLEHCRQCGNGWGKCRAEHACVIEDDIVGLQADLAAAEGVVLVTPVYFGEVSESMRSVFDRIRRCNFSFGDPVGRLVDTPVLCIAAAGGSGGGITICLLAMERLAQHMRGKVADLIGVTQRNRAYTLEHIRNAGAALASK